MRGLMTAVTVACLALPCHGKLYEADYQKSWANKHGGRTEVVVPNGRVDIVTKTHAIEVEYARKWKNAIGQALWYSIQTNKKPGIVLILEKKSDRKYLVMLESTLKHAGLDVKVWEMDKSNIEL